MPTAPSVSTVPLAAEFIARRDRLAAAMIAEQIDLMLLSSRVNLYYYAGTTQEGQWLFHPGKNPVLAVRKDRERALLDLADPAAIQLELETLHRYSDLARYSTALLPQRTPTRLGLELDQLTAASYLRIAQLFPDSTVVNVSPKIRELRMIKSDWELGQSRQAASILHAAAVEGFRLLAEGLTESELAARLTQVIIERGAQALVRVHRPGNELPHVLLSSGPNGAT